MNVWKSPLLLVGILVILIAGGALIAPYFIDWSSYRGQFERYGRQLTGRETKVLGEIQVRLFPWPRMTIKDVRVANPPGAMVPELFRADDIDVRLRLAPLLSGRLEVEGLEINRPVIGLERLASGQGSWIIEPQIGLSEVFGADDVALSGISITNGTIVLADGQRQGEAQLDGFNAFVTARSLNGPWKLRGEAIVEDQGIAISLNTGKWRKGQPLKFGLRLAPMEQAGLTYTFDGESSAGKSHEITGKLKIIPTASKNGKTDAQENFRPMVFRADIKADFEQVEFTKIEIAPRDAVDVRTFVTGDAVVKFGSVLQVDSNLKALNFDVDSVLGNRGRKTLRSMRSLDSLAGFIESLPKNVHLHSAVDLRTVMIAGETYDGLKIDLDVIESTLKINQLTVALPGQTKATFKGSLLAGLKRPQLIGDLELDMISLKDFSKWLAEDYKREIEKKWSGSRGRFKLAAKVDLSPQHFRLADGVFSLDAAKGKLGFSLANGEEQALTVVLKSNVIDADNYAPEGLFEETGVADLSEAVVQLLTGLVGERNFGIEIKSDKLKMNGVEALDVAINFNANENSIDFRQFKLGNVGNASVDLSGSLKFTDDRIDGLINGVIEAGDPTKLVKLVSAGEPSKEWIAAVSPLVLKLNGNAVTGETDASGMIKFSGSAGKSTASGWGKFSGELAKWRQGKIHLSGKMAGESARSLLRIFGVKVTKGEDGSGRLSVSATGKLTQGMATSADFEAFGVQSQFAGRVSLVDKKPQADGRLAVLIENTDKLFDVLGLAPGAASPIGKVFSGEGVLKFNSQVFDLQKINGTAAGTSYSGAIAIDLKPQLPVVDVKVKSGRLSLPFILGTAMLGRDGKLPSAATRFSPTGLDDFKLNVEIATDRFSLWSGFDLTKGIFSLGADKGRIKISAGGEKNAGNLVLLQLDGVVGEQLTRLSGTIKAKVPMADILAIDDSAPGQGVIEGMMVVEGEFAGSGRTPGGLMASLGGKGVYEISKGVVKNISPEKFAKKLPQAETEKDIEVLIANGLRNGDMPFGDGKGAVKIENGVAKFLPLVMKGSGARGVLQGFYEIGNRLVDVSIRLKLDKSADIPGVVPGFEIAYAGPPDALAPSSDFSALKSYLTVAALNRTLDKLEALEEEQRRLVEEEKKVRAEAEAKFKAQEEKKRLLREKQRRLLREATRKKELALEKKHKAEAEAARKIEEEKGLLERKRLERKRLEQKRLEQKRLEQKRLEQKRLEQKRLEQKSVVPNAVILPKAKPVLPKVDVKKLAPLKTQNQTTESVQKNIPPKPKSNWRKFRSLDDLN